MIAEQRKNLPHTMYKFGVFLLLPFLVSMAFGQPNKYTARTGHIHVESSNRFMDVVADNYQVYAEVEPQSGTIQLTGLMKSFEFKLGALDRAFNSSRIDLSQYSKFRFEGRLVNLDEIDFTKPGTYPGKVTGNLYIGGYKRLTSATGTLEVRPDGRIHADADFDIQIEEESMNTINKLMRERLPSVVALDTDKLGISRKIELRLVANLRPR
jgi:hypothetical protein